MSTISDYNLWVVGGVLFSLNVSVYVRATADIVAGVSLSVTAQGQSSGSEVLLDRVNVTGDPANIYDKLGSAQYISAGQIREHSYDDINRVMRRVPGGYLREKDGYGRFPNIRLHG